MVSDLWVVTTYFNSERYVSRRRNYERFLTAIREVDVPFIVIECAFGDEPFELEPSSNIIQRRSSSVLWQKERLLNVALAAFPPECRKIAWIDADVLFEAPNWPVECSRLLDQVAVAQLFDRVVRLPRGHDSYRGIGESWSSFCSEYVAEPGCEREGWFRHGHTGFAWAARRDVLEACSFFDMCLTGSADHLMSHGFVGDFHSRCIEFLIGLDTPLHREYVQWARRAHAASEGKLGVLRGSVYHLWHGELEQRKYFERSQEFRALELQPTRDLRLADNGCWEWTGSSPAMGTWAREMFADRREDG